MMTKKTFFSVLIGDSVRRFKTGQMINRAEIQNQLYINFVATPRSCQQRQAWMMPCSLKLVKNYKGWNFLQSGYHDELLSRRTYSIPWPSKYLSNAVADGKLNCKAVVVLAYIFYSLGRTISLSLFNFWPFQVWRSHCLNLVIKNEHPFTVAAISRSASLFSACQIHRSQNDKKNWNYSIHS